MTHRVYEARLDEFVSAARRVAQHGLVLCGSGNLSWRVDDECMLITATRSWLGELTKDQVAICGMRDGVSLNGIAPSIEIGFHRAILRDRRDIHVVLHFQSPSATVLACGGEHAYDDLFVIPEIPYYVGPVSVVPYMDPGSAELAAAVTSAMREHDVAILRNHGQVAAGKDLRDAFQKAVYFELAASIRLRAGENLQRLPQAGVEALYRARRASREHAQSA